MVFFLFGPCNFFYLRQDQIIDGFHFHMFYFSCNIRNYYNWDVCHSDMSHIALKTKKKLQYFVGIMRNSNTIKYFCAIYTQFSETITYTIVPVASACNTYIFSFTNTERWIPFHSSPFSSLNFFGINFIGYRKERRNKRSWQKSANLKFFCMSKKFTFGLYSEVWCEPHPIFTKLFDFKRFLIVHSGKPVLLAATLIETPSFLSLTASSIYDGFWQNFLEVFALLPFYWSEHTIYQIVLSYVEKSNKSINSIGTWSTDAFPTGFFTWMF